jgi:thymidylate synthase (FAD)
MDSHAQKEIRDYANVIGNEIVSKLCPVTWQAFLDYRMNAKYLTALDVRQIQKLSEFTNGEVGTLDVCTGLLMPNRQDVINMCLIDDWRGLAKSRERDECLDKLEALGLIE